MEIENVKSKASELANEKESKEQESKYYQDLISTIAAKPHDQQSTGAPVVTKQRGRQPRVKDDESTAAMRRKLEIEQLAHESD